MRPLILLAMLFTLSWPAGAQTLALHQNPATPAPAAKGIAGAIIPGSPLAALTGAENPPPADTDNATPFGTNNIGLPLTGAFWQQAGGMARGFFVAIQQSTRLEPVSGWLASFGSVPTRRAHLRNILAGISITLLPALLVEFLLRTALVGLRRGVLTRAALRLEPLEDDDGLASAEAGETEAHPRRVSFLAWARRFGLGFVYLVLALLPVLGFVLVMAALLSAGLLATPQAQRAVIGLSNAYLFCRVSLELSRFIFAPQSDALRLVRMPGHRAAWGVSWLAVVLYTASFGYAGISVAEVLGLDHDGTGTLIHILALVAHIEVAIAIWHSRFVVAGWIRGRRDATGFVALVRRRVASIWHYLALFYVLALWLALAAGVHHAFGLLLRIIFVFIAVGILGRLAWELSAALLERLFPGPDDAGAKHPKLYARVHAYNPALKFLIRTCIGFAMLILLLQGWGLDAIDWLAADAISRALLAAAFSIVITIAITLLLWELANVALTGRIDRLTATGRTRQASRLATLLPMLRAGLGCVLGLFAALICLSKIGVNLVPLLAVSGVAGIAIGFGSQKLVQDIITGLFLLLEDAMQVGDVVSLASMSGVVERLSLRTIRLRGGDGSINIIPFSAVTTVTNMTRDFGYAQISINVGYAQDIDRVSAVLMDIAQTMRAEPAWGAMMKDDLQLFGLDEFGPNALVIMGQIRTGPGQHWSVRREFYGRVQKRFCAEGIEIPHNPQRVTIDPAVFQAALAAHARDDAARIAAAPPAVEAEEAKILGGDDARHSSEPDDGGN
jgi:small conductance mechanosensitive channel